MTDHALLLVNLGSPASTSVDDVRRYLDQFLMDPYVVDLPWPLRRLLVSLILIRRPQQSAHAYASIWWDEGSPLIVLSRQLQEAVRPHWPHGPVALAMRYGEPSLENTLRQLAAQGVTKVTLAPLYPQFAQSTTTTVIEEARRVIAQHGLGIAMGVLPPFFAEPEYLAVCYRSQCQRTAEAFAERLGLRPEQWSVSFQSRLGRDKWIEPYTETRLGELGAQGVGKLLVMCPAFVADCIETLEEIGLRGQEQFAEAGGGELKLVPCVNSHPQWVEALASLCERVMV